MDLVIKQSISQQEPVTTELVDALYRLTKPDPITGQPSVDAVLVGRLSVPAAYEDAVTFLNTQFSSAQDNGSDFQITVLNNNYYIRFADPVVVSILEDAGVIPEEGGLTLSEASIVTFIRTLFTGNAVIEHFDEFKYFTKMNTQQDIGAIFQDCSNLKSINLANLTRLFNALCRGCVRLSKFDGENGEEGLLSLPNLIGPFNNGSIEAFKECAQLKHVANLGMTSYLPSGTFNSCTLLEDVNLPSSCIEIGDTCFGSDSKLHTINLSQVTTIKNNAFNGCSSLEYCVGGGRILHKEN